MFSAPVELGKIICPHYGLMIEGDHCSLFLTHALSQEQEVEFNAKNPLVPAKQRKKKKSQD